MGFVDFSLLLLLFCIGFVDFPAKFRCVCDLQASEAFLQRMVALYASSHYKNTPNDLILMSDAPAHHLFALLGPVDETQVLFLPTCCFEKVTQQTNHALSKENPFPQPVASFFNLEWCCAYT